MPDLELIGWSEVAIDPHNGSRLVDLDGDDDLDIVSVGWQHGSLSVYEKLAVSAGERRADSAHLD